MKSWKKRWKSELDEITPVLRDDIKNTPIPTTDNIENNGGNTAALSVSKNKLTPIVAAITAILICAAILCLCLIRPAKTYNEFLFTLEINPAVTITTDANGTVTGIIASNVDADLILSDENVREIKGKSLDEAITFYTDCAAKLGYIDLEKKGSAVRISGLGNEELLGKAQTALESYFSTKGIFAVVVAENVNKDEFSLRSGISVELSVDEIVKFIKDSAILFSDRKAKDLSLQDLQSLYNKLIVEDKLFDYVNESLSGNIKRIIKNAEDIQNLSQLYFKILNHSDNPIKPFGDYWIVKNLYANSIDGEFAELMYEMETALKNYKIDYGVDIESIKQLKDAANSYLRIPADTLVTLLENLSFDKFKELSSDIMEILAITGLVTGDFVNFMQAPQSFEDYVEKTSAIIQSEYKSRLERYNDLYNKNRQPIEKADYASFIESIIQQYGSLDDYWRTVKN